MTFYITYSSTNASTAVKSNVDLQVVPHFADFVPECHHRPVQHRYHVIPETSLQVMHLGTLHHCNMPKKRSEMIQSNRLKQPFTKQFTHYLTKQR